MIHLNNIAKKVFLMLLLLPYFALSQSEHVDSLLQIVNNSTDDTERAEKLYYLSLEFIRKDPAQTLVYASQCIEIAEKRGIKNVLCDCYMATAMVNHRRSEFDSAIVIFEKVLKISQTIKDTSRMTMALGNLGMVNRRTGQYDKAIEYFLQALRLNQQRGNKEIEANLLADIGKINALAGDWGEAMVFQRRALNIFIKQSQDLGISNTYNSIGVIHQEWEHLDSAMIYFEQSLEIKEKMENWYGWATTKDNICLLLSLRNESRNASRCFEDLIIVEERLGAKAELSLTLSNLADHYAILGEFNKGIKAANRSYEIASKTGNLKVQKSACEALVELHQAKGEYRKALEFKQESTLLNDSLLNETKTQQISELQIEYETEKNKQQIALQQLEIENKNQRIQFQRILTGGIVAALMALFGFVFWRSKQREKHQQQETAIHHQEHLLQATIETMESERKRISKDLHDGIGQQLSGLKMAWQQLSEKWKKESYAQTLKLDELTNILGKTANDVREISHQLMPTSLARLGLVAALEDILQHSFSSTPINYEFEYMDADSRYNENIEIGFYRIVQEAFNNIIKHSGAKNISLELFETKYHLVLMIEDDGIGMDNKIHKGNGLYNIKSRVKALNASVNFEQRSTKGLNITVRVPLAELNQ